MVVSKYRTNGHRYAYPYAMPYLYVGMKEFEAAKIIEEVARLTRARVVIVISEGVRTSAVRLSGSRALMVIGYLKPYLVKWHRLANLCLTLFRYRKVVPLDRFDSIIIALFGEPLRLKGINDVLLGMTEEQYKRILERAQELAPP